MPWETAVIIGAEPAGPAAGDNPARTGTSDSGSEGVACGAAR